MEYDGPWGNAIEPWTLQVVKATAQHVRRCGRRDVCHLLLHRFYSMSEILHIKGWLQMSS